MKIAYTLLLMIFLAIPGFSQMVITHSANNPVAGDSTTCRQIVISSPGASGSGQVWDFSTISTSGKIHPLKVNSSPSENLDGLSENNLSLTDNGYEYILLSEGNGYQEVGYINPEKHLTLTYSDPIERMRFPMAFGDSYSDSFTGTAFYNGRSRIDLTGTYRVAADGWGTLILPNHIMHNVIRVKSVRSSLQTNVCGTLSSTTIRYNWYAPGYRYPVLSYTETEQGTSTDKPVLTTTAYLCVDQPYNPQSTAVLPAGQVTQTADQSVTVMVYPNPFKDKTTFHYFLRKPLVVSIELFDMTGKKVERMVDKQNQSEGLHEGVIDAVELSLNPGIYYVRFTFDQQVVVQKIVRI